MIGTYRPNLFHRLGDAWAALKGVPVSPGALYPPQPNNSTTGWINWQGWPEFEKQSQDEGRRDMQRAKTAITSPWVFADVQAIANEFSTAELIVKERIGDKLEDVDNHPLEILWESPNEHMGRSFVTAFWAWSYVLASKAYLYWVPDQTGTELMEVWPVPPWMIRPVPDANEFISGYAFKSSANGPVAMIPPEYITYSHSVNLFDVRDGMAFLAAAMTEISADIAASQWNLNFFDENNGTPDGMISLSADTLDPDIERVRWELRDFFGGTKRGLVVARSNDMKYTPFGRSQKDMEFGQGRELASKVIGRTLGFPDGYWSDLANRANAEQARRTMISGAVWPLLVRLAEDMNARRRGVLHRWYGDQYRAGFKDIRPEDKEAQAKELKMYEPFLTINDLRSIIGKPELDKDDPRGLMLVAEIAKGAPLPGTPAALLLEDLQAKKDEQQAKELAAQVEAGTIPDPNAPPEAPEVPPEPPPPILGYHIEQGVVSRNEARERLSLPPEDETKSQNLRDLQAMLAVVKMAVDAGIGIDVAAQLTGLPLPATLATSVPSPEAPGATEAPTPEGELAEPPAPPEAAAGKALTMIDNPSYATSTHGFGIIGNPMIADLHLWERKALKRFKSTGKAAVGFESSAIPTDEHARIAAALKAADSTEAIKAAFKGESVVDKIIAAGGKKGDEIQVWRHKETGKWAVSIGDWASEETTAAIHKVLGDDVEIDAEWVPGDGYEAIKAAFKRDAVDTILDDVDAEARAWAEEATNA